MTKPAKLDPVFPVKIGVLTEVVYRLRRAPEGWVMEVFELPRDLLDGEKPRRSYGPDSLGLIENAFEREMAHAAETRR